MHDSSGSWFEERKRTLHTFLIPARPQESKKLELFGGCSLLPFEGIRHTSRKSLAHTKEGDNRKHCLKKAKCTAFVAIFTPRLRTRTHWTRCFSPESNLNSKNETSWTGTWPGAQKNLMEFWNYPKLNKNCLNLALTRWKLLQSNFKKIKSSLYSRYHAEACNEWRGPSPLLSA